MRKRRNILVTGGAGFIGSHLVEALLRQGQPVSVVDNFDDFYPAAIKRANLQEASRLGRPRVSSVDIRDRQALGRLFKKERPDVVVHLAARAGVRPSIELPELYEEVNVRGTLNLLQLAASYQVEKFIFGSSSSVYGASAKVPFSENEVQMKPLSPYAATKLAGELVCHTFAHLYQLPIVCLRFFTVYGPRQRPDLAIHKFLAQITSGNPVPIFGDGTSARDYTYVDDIVTGILAAMDYEAPYEIFNLGNSVAVKLLDLVRHIESSTGLSAAIDFQPVQPGDVPLTWADISKARRLLGYEPRTSIAAGIERFCAWYRKLHDEELTRVAL
ncbi:MAG: epimerase [Acidobacteria bacterium]|nr:MAG: epimerase [Acidobacteriota bacterium]